MPYLEATLLPAQANDVLELDEVWSFVGNKANQVWIWIALCRRTRQVVAWWYGLRDKLSCRALWSRIPPSYRSSQCYSDLYEVYSRVIPASLHRACTKQAGETNHVERLNLTLRQSVARLVRKTLSFSKKLPFHLYSLRLFFVAYNKRKAKTYLRNQVR